MPESFAALIPAKPGAVYKFGGEAGSEEAVGSQLAAKLTNAIRQKATQVRTKDLLFSILMLYSRTDDE